jgi:proline dehydrogenase
VSALDYFLSRSLPLVPRPIVRRIARRYIAGEILPDAVKVVRALNGNGFMATLDVLGESVDRGDLVAGEVQEYLAALRAIRNERLDSNVSVKLTQMGLKLDPALCLSSMRSLCRASADLGIFVRIDMEDSGCTTATLDLYRRLREEGFANLGVVLQACLRRSLQDVRALPEGCNARLCKGIYVEPRAIAYKDRAIISANYLRLLQEMLDRGFYVGIATHDEELVFEASRIVDRLRLGREAYEFQMLLGVDEQLRGLIRGEGHRLRVYVPYGQTWHAYSLRRLKENPRIAGYVALSLVQRRRG